MGRQLPSCEHNPDRQLCSARLRDPPLGLHLFLKRSQLFPLQAGVASGLTGPCLWLACTLPIPAQLLRSVRAASLAPGCPSMATCGHFPRIPTWHWGALLSLAPGSYNLSPSVRSPWEVSKDRKGFGLPQPTCPVFRHVTLSSPKKRPVSVLC